MIFTLRQFTPLPLRRSCSGTNLRMKLARIRTSKTLLYLSIARRIVSRTIGLKYGLVMSRRPLLFRKLGAISSHGCIRQYMHGTVRGSIAVCSTRAGLSGTRSNMGFGVTRGLRLKSIELLRRRPIGIGRNKRRCAIVTKDKIVNVLSRPRSTVGFLRHVGSLFRVRALVRGRLLCQPVGGIIVYNKTNSFVLRRTLGRKTSTFLANRVRCRRCFNRSNRLRVTIVKRCRDRRCAGRLFCSVVKRIYPSLPICVAAMSAGPVGCLWCVL